MASKPMQRTLAELRKRGYTCHIVEVFNHWVKVRQDFGGFADVLAYKTGFPGVLAVQCCEDNGGGVATHMKKLTSVSLKGIPRKDSKELARYQNIVAWLGANNGLEVWGWGLRGERGKRKTWVLREIKIVERDLQPL